MLLAIALAYMLRRLMIDFQEYDDETAVLLTTNPWGNTASSLLSSRNAAPSSRRQKHTV